jgi:uncharacterized protein with beta-barrel porin domain
MFKNLTNELALATLGMLDKIKKKLSYCLAIAVMVFGSTFGSMNAANAADVSLANNGTSGFAQINEAVDALIAAENAIAHAIAMGGANITAATLSNPNAGDLVITVSDAGSGQTLTFTGDVDATGGNITLILSDDATTLSLGGDVTEAVGEVIAINLDGSDIVKFTGTSKNVDSAIVGVGAGDGKIILDGSTTFDDAIGATAIGTIEINASKSGTFGAAVDSGVITNLGTITLSAATGVNTLTNSGTVNLNAAVTNVAANNEAAIVMNTSDSVLNLNDTGNETQDMIITATTDGFGTINIFDGTDDEAGSTTTLAADSLIGANGTSIGTLNVGKSDGTKAGNLVTADGSAIFADAINITGGNHENEDSMLSAIENLTGAVTLSATGAADATLKTLTAAVTIAGDINSASGTDGAGFTIIDVDIATTTTGNIGNSVAIEKADIAATGIFNMDGATNTIEATNFSGDGELEFGDTTAQTLTGAITSTTNEHGTVENGNTGGLVTITGTVGAEDKRVKEIALLDNTDTTFQSAVFALNLDIDTAAAEDLTTFTTGNVIGDDDATAGSLDIAGGTIVLDTTAVTGTTVFDARETLNGDGGVELRGLVIQPPANFTTGTVTFIDGATDASIDADDVSGVSVTDTALTDFTVNITAGVADVTITAAAKSATATGAALAITDNDAAALHQFMEAAKAGESALVTTLNESLTGVNSGVTSTTTNLAKQASPQTDLITGSTVAAQAVTGSVQGIMSSRMASLRSGDAYFGTGVAAGAMSAQSGFIQVFGSTAEQKNTTVGSGTQAGYESDTQGIAIGFDGVTDDGMTIGASLATANTDVDGKGTGKSTNSIDTYSASIYMDRTTDAGYVEGSVTFGLSENSSSRKVNTAGLDRTYTGSYDSTSMSLNISAGIPTEVANGYLTPFGSFTMTNMDTDAYTEKSTVANDGLRLKVDQNDLTSAVGSIGFKYHTEMSNGGTPMISLALNNEFGDNTIDTTSTYQGGGTSFKTSATVEELSATLGLGYSYGSDSTSIEFAYEADVNDDDYLSHYGSIKIVGKF